jgi:hypothetical protein
MLGSAPIYNGQPFCGPCVALYNEALAFLRHGLQDVSSVEPDYGLSGHVAKLCTISFNVYDDECIRENEIYPLLGRLLPDAKIHRGGKVLDSDNSIIAKHDYVATMPLKDLDIVYISVGVENELGIGGDSGRQVAVAS